MDDVGADQAVGHHWLPTRESFIRGRETLRRQTPEVGAVCPNWGWHGSVRGARGNSRPYRESAVQVGTLPTDP